MCEQGSAPTASCSNVAKDGWAARKDDFSGIVQRQERTCIVKPSPTQWVDEHCKRHNICEDELASPRRTRRNAKLRAEIAIMAQQLGIATLHEVATRFDRSVTLSGTSSTPAAVQSSNSITQHRHHVFLPAMNSTSTRFTTVTGLCTPRPGIGQRARSLAFPPLACC